jgi:Na+/H+ antiporter NhaD/arsenite permease-like protein
MEISLGSLMLFMILALLVIVITIIGVAVGRYPWLHMNRATIALVGATVLISMGAIPLERAYAALDLDTLVLLFAMMIINVNLRLAGFFRLVGNRVIYWARSPRQLLGLIILVAGILSALFLNDTIVLVFTPFVIEIVTSLKRNPIPYLIGLVTAANIGSTATIIGNPQNMLIGLSSRMSFVTFSTYLTPVALVGLSLAWLLIILVYRNEFNSPPFSAVPQFRDRPYRPLLRKSMIATSLMALAFLAGFSIPLAALAAASLLLVTRRLKPERVFREIDWALLVFFSGLFVVTGAIEEIGASRQLFVWAQPLAERSVLTLSLVSVILSNLISNVPAVLLFRPVVPQFPNPQQTWLTLAMATTLAGNLTLLGSVANLIVAETAKRAGIQLSFREYLKAGVPITLATLLVGVIWLSYVF